MTTPLQHTSLGELGYSPLGATSLGELGVLVIELPDTEVHPPGMGRRYIEEEDEVIMAVIVAFLTMKGQ